MTKFKVGDKVRILKTGAIEGIEAEDGTILEVVGVDVSDGTPYLLDIDGEPCCTFEYELQYLEKVESKPTKNQRITALEEAQATLKETVEQLKARVEQLGALVEAQSTSVVQNITVKSDADVSEIAERLVARLHRGETVKPTLTPNQKRKAIIDEAKAFVEDVTKRMSQYGHGNKLGEHGEITTKARDWILKAEFIVNDEKRTVVTLLRPRYMDDIVAKGIAKYAPDDVFNADIGKAIALGRALGLDVSKFEQAVKPTKVVVGQLLTFNKSDEWHRKLVYRVDSMENSVENLTIVTDDIDNTHVGRKAIGYFENGKSRSLTIIDDTEAQY